MDLTTVITIVGAILFFLNAVNCGCTQSKSVEKPLWLVPMWFGHVSERNSAVCAAVVLKNNVVLYSRHCANQGNGDATFVHIGQNIFRIRNTEPIGNGHLVLGEAVQADNLPLGVVLDRPVLHEKQIAVPKEGLVANYQKYIDSPPQSAKLLEPMPENWATATSFLVDKVATYGAVYYSEVEPGSCFYALHGMCAGFTGQGSEFINLHFYEEEIKQKANRLSTRYSQNVPSAQNS